MAEFTIDARQAFAAFDAIERRLGDLEDAMKRTQNASKSVFTPSLDGARKEAAALDSLQREYNELDVLVKRFKANLQNTWDPRAVSTYTKAIAEAEREMKRLETGASAVGVNLKKSLQTDATQGFGSSLLSSLKGAAIAATAGLSLGSAIKEGIALNAEYERIHTSLTVILKDAGKADKLLGKLNQFAASTPFQSDQINQAATALLAFGVGEDEVIARLKEIGDLSAGTGKDFNELATIYGKARVAGVLYAEDINQLVEAGIPIIGEFAKQLGVSESQVKKLASEGKIGFNQLQTAFTGLTSEGGRFAGLMEAQSKTIGGLVSTLKDNFSIALRNAFSGVIPIIKEVVDFTTRLIGATKSESQALEEERISFLGVANQVRLTNTGTEERTRLINNLKQQYPQFLGQIDAEKATNEELQPILDKINQSYVIRIALQKQQEKLRPLLEAQAEAESNLAKQQVSVNEQLSKAAEIAKVDIKAYDTQEEQIKAVTKALEEQALFSKGQGQFATTTPLNEQAKALEALKASQLGVFVQTNRQGQEQKKVNDAVAEQQKVVEQLKKTYGEVFDLATATPPPGKGTKGTDFTPKVDDKEIKRQQKELEDLAKSFDQIRSAVAPDDFNTQLRAVEKKYDDLVKANEEGIAKLEAIEAKRGLSPELQAQLEEAKNFTVKLQERQLEELANVLVEFNAKEAALEEEHAKRKKALADKIQQGDIQALEDQRKIREQEIAIAEEKGKKLIAVARANGASEKELADLQRQFDLEAQKARLEAQLQFQQQLLTIVGAGNTQQAEEIKKTIELIKAQLATLNVEIETPAPTTGGGLQDKSLLELLGINLSDGDAAIVEESAQRIIASIQEITAARVAAAEEEIQAANAKVDAAQQALDEEIRLAELGFASNVTLRRKELEDAKKNQQQAIAEKQKAAKLQLAIDSLTQASSIATSATNLIQSWSSLPFGVGLIAAAAQIAAMIGFIISVRARARAISKARYGKSAFLTKDNIVEGRTHAHGGEILEVQHGELVQVGDDGKRTRVEVVRHERVREYMDLLQAANSGSREEIARQALRLVDFDSMSLEMRARLLQTPPPDRPEQPTVSRKKVIRRVFGDDKKQPLVVQFEGQDNGRTNYLLEQMLRFMIDSEKNRERWTPDGKTRFRGNNKTTFIN